MRRKSYLAIALACALVAAGVVVALVLPLLRPSGEIIRDAPRATDETTREALTELDAIEITEPMAVGLANQNLPIEENTDQTFPRAPRKNTVMVYMTGTDLEERGGNASIDLKEMIDSGFDASDTNVVVYTGGSYRWLINIPNNRNCVIEVTNGGGQVVASTKQSCNMGSASTLSGFVSWACENYPAERMALIIWDHGGGPAKGCSFDQLFQRDPLMLSEMSEAMRTAGFGDSRKLDWVGFDACLMNSLENAQLWKEFAHYFVASQDIEDKYGWNYGFLPAIKDAQDSEAVVSRIVDYFKEYFETNNDDPSNAKATLSAIDLDALGDVEEAISRMSKSLLWDFKNDDFATLAQAREQSRSFGGSGGGLTDKAMVDVVDLADHLSAAHPGDAKALRVAVQRALVANFASASGANGCSLYFPTYGGESTVTPVTRTYGQMLAAYGEQSSAVVDEWPEPNVVFVEATSGSASGVIHQTLTAEQTKSLASASYTVLANYEGKGYVPVMQNVRVKANAEGAIEVPADPQVLVLAEGEPIVVPVDEVERHGERTLYTCKRGSLLPAPEYVGTSGAADAVLTFAEESGVVSVASSTLAGSDESAPDGRLGVDLARYQTLRLSYDGWQCPERGDDERLLPYSSWTEQGEGIVWDELPVGIEATFALAPVSSLEGDYALQLVFTDVNGRQHASELVELAHLERTERRVATEAGELVFSCDKDHARLLDYNGKDTCLEIPDTVEGLPVTEVGNGALNNVRGIRELKLPNAIVSIGNNALNLPDLSKLALPSKLSRIGRNSLCGCAALKELQLPSTLIFIGQGSLRGLGVRTLELPKSLIYLGAGALSCCESLEAYELQKGTLGLSCTDGVLFSLDGTTLRAFPAGRTGAYETPKGTTAIAYGAFAGTSLSSLTLSEGVTSIANAAFIGSEYDGHSSLEEVRLPASLESIGAFAFGLQNCDASIEDAPEMDELTLGAQLSYIGEEAFGGLRLKRFVVDEANASFAAAGGLLTNKMGDTVIEAPGCMGPVVSVPEGVTTVGSGVFSRLRPGCEFVLPATLTRISQEAFVSHVEKSASGGKRRVYDVRFHCDAGSAAAEFAERHGISWDEHTDVGTLTAKVTSGALSGALS